MNYKYPEELIQIAEHHGGDLIKNDGEFYIRIDTGDRTSRENYEEIIDCEDDIKVILEAVDSDYKLDELWADHDTQIIEFKKLDK